MLPRHQLVRAALLLGAITAIGSGAHAESALRLPAPTEWGEHPAWTYDDAHERVGNATVSVQKLGGGRFEVSVATGIRGGARNRASARLEKIPGTDDYRVLSQRSLSYDAEGTGLELLRIDHVERTATCTPQAGKGKPRVLLLPKGDRIANVLLPFVFQPLARGEIREVAFQIFLCGRSGPRVVEMRSEVKRREHTFDYSEEQESQARKSVGFVEIEYWPNLMLVPRRLLPRFSFWLDMDGDYLAHRIPLYSEGPEVLVARTGWNPNTLEAPK